MPNVLTNQDLREALRDRMEAAGMPIERVQGSHPANQLYRVAAGPHAGKKLRLRTNRDYAVMALAEGSDYTALIPSLQNVEFVGIACVNHSGQVECYIVPAPRLIEDMKAGHGAASERLNRGPSGSKVRILYFGDRTNRPWHGYARKYAEFRLGSAVSAPRSRTAHHGARRGSDVIERAQSMIAAEFGVPTSAVRISVDLIGAGPFPNDQNRQRD
jgi:hypothetical protein